MPALWMTLESRNCLSTDLTVFALLLQAANLWANGIDKLSLEERRQFVLDNLDDLKRGAKDPFKET